MAIGFFVLSFFDGTLMDEVLRTKSFLLYQFRLLLIRPNMPLRHRRSGVPRVPSRSIAGVRQAHPTATHFVRPSMAA